MLVWTLEFIVSTKPQHHRSKWHIRKLRCYLFPFSLLFIPQFWKRIYMFKTIVSVSVQNIGFLWTFNLIISLTYNNDVEPSQNKYFGRFSLNICVAVSASTYLQGLWANSLLSLKMWNVSADFRSACMSKLVPRAVLRFLFRHFWVCSPHLQSKLGLFRSVGPYLCSFW